MWFASKTVSLIVFMFLFFMGALIFFYSPDAASSISKDVSKATHISKDLEYAMQAIGISFMVIPAIFIFEIAAHFSRNQD